MTNENRLVTGLIAGALLGTIAGLLLAPKPGKESRQIVSTRAVEFRQKAGDYVDTLRQKIRKGEAGHNMHESSNDHVATTS